MHNRLIALLLGDLARIRLRTVLIGTDINVIEYEPEQTLLKYPL